MTTPTTTETGLAIDTRFQRPATEERLQRAAAALREKGYAVEIVDTPAEARAAVNRMLPDDESILTVSSETLRTSGLDDDINTSGRFDAVRPKLMRLREEERLHQMRAIGAAPDVVVGSVHALTEDGRLLTASGSGSQLGPYSFGAGRVIWVVGSQKIVPDLDTALRRIETYAYPREDVRAREAYGVPATLSKILIVNNEMFPGRITVVLVREPIGF
ncbi:lactate utilization protein [Streptosporangium sp. NBC_01755]|uniref:LUD domain-containing protein n=1 Tax=unclassified Streptosporangium TaxID=2632669 RepID=UPI002DDAE0F4|nr:MULTISPECIES: LUD domain-containing protein [unclassified Streptosporangium]WSA28301.1 lactate utilization protein [Streptosporangium sp. NBC_01810]WSD00221.1 lactate utilization protein [Streptosporangium sp. NBC_01755]